MEKKNNYYVDKILEEIDFIERAICQIKINDFLCDEILVYTQKRR